MKNKALSLIAGSLLAGSLVANAIPISGSIGIGALGSFASIDKTANTVSFTPASPANNAQVNQVFGDFAAAGLLGTVATYKDFTYSPLTVVNPLWITLGGAASFDLTAVTIINEAGTGLVLNGTGTVYLTGYDATPGTWSFSADATGAVFNFSSTVTTGVPDGGMTLMLLGSALTGLALIRRKI